MFHQQLRAERALKPYSSSLHTRLFMGNKTTKEQFDQAKQSINYPLFVNFSKIIAEKKPYRDEGTRFFKNFSQTSDNHVHGQVYSRLFYL